MKEIMNAIEKYNAISLELDTRGQELKEDGKTRASKKLQTLFLELKPLLELYTTIPANERKTFSIIIKEEETYSKSPTISVNLTQPRIILQTRENGHSKILSDTTTLYDDDYRHFCIIYTIIQDMNISEIKEKFKKEIIKGINMAIKSKENKLKEIIEALSGFDSEDKEDLLYKQLYELFGLEREYKETGNEFCLSLVLNQIEKIQKMIENN